MVRTGAGSPLAKRVVGGRIAVLGAPLDFLDLGEPAGRPGRSLASAKGERASSVTVETLSPLSSS